MVREDTFLLKVDKVQWKKSRDGLRALVKTKVKKVGEHDSFDFDDLLDTLYAIKRERAKQPPQEYEIWFPSAQARNEFISWIRNPKLLLSKVCPPPTVKN